jgi:hypothetical protein
MSVAAKRPKVVDNNLLLFTKRKTRHFGIRLSLLTIKNCKIKNSIILFYLYFNIYLLQTPAKLLTQRIFLLVRLFGAPRFYKWYRLHCIISVLRVPQFNFANSPQEHIRLLYSKSSDKMLTKLSLFLNIKSKFLLYFINKSGTKVRFF